MFNNKRDWQLVISACVVTILVLAAIGAGVLAILRPRLIAQIGSSNEETNIETPLLSLGGNQEDQVVGTVAKASPAVISIVISKNVPVYEQYFQNFNPFQDFFGGGGGFNFQVPQQRQKGTEKQEIGGGTGFLLSTDGLAVTNRHVVEDTQASYTAITSDGKKYEVEVLAKDPTLDVAIIKIKGGKNFTYLTFDDSDKIKVGQTAIAIGNALGEFKNTVSVGVVSGLYRSITAADGFGEAETLDEVIQTDAAINPGNSGGPLLNLHGKVVGVNVAMARGSENIGFALPANVVKSVVDSVRTNNKIVRPYLGIRYVAITPSLKEKNKLAVDYGVLVIRGENREDLAVIPGSPADKAGLVENDIVLELDGVKLDENKSLASLIRKKTIGQTVTLKVWHKGETKTVSVKLEKAPE